MKLGVESGHQSLGNVEIEEKVRDWAAYKRGSGYTNTSI